MSTAVSPQTTAPMPHTLRRVPFTDIPAFSSLFEQYCTNYEAVAEFYAGDFRSRKVRHAAVERAVAYDRDREALAAVLLEQNERWGLDAPTRANIDALRRPETGAVVTGQQIGLLSGPLYTIYKTITTLQLARQLTEETGRPVVPVFWAAGEDHDFEEIAGTALLQRNKPVFVRYAGHTPPEEGNAGPVGRLVLTEQIEQVISQVDAALPPTDFKQTVMDAVRAAYRPGTTLEDAFVLLMKALFPESGLVFVQPDDARLKQLVAPLFRRDLEDHEQVIPRLQAVSDTLAERYHAQVHIRPTNLFLLEEEGRFPIDAEDGRFTLRGKGTTFSLDELLAVLEETPERFSPNVVLRPLMQDMLFPTAAYVAGPGEIAYFAQYKPVYEWAGVPMPVIYPRASVSLVETKVQKVLDKFQLSVTDFGDDLEQLFRRVVLASMEIEVDDLFKEAGRHLHEAINMLKPSLEEVDRTLNKSAEATRVALVKEMERLKERVVRAEKRQQEEIYGQLEKAHANLYPGGKLQERVLSVLYVLNKYSPELLSTLQQQLSLDTTEHQVVEL